MIDPKTNKPLEMPAYCLVASYADGTRQLFYGDTDEEAQEKLEAAMSEHGQITWYDDVTDLNYQRGKYYKLCEPEETVIYMGEWPCDEE